MRAAMTTPSEPTNAKPSRSIKSWLRGALLVAPLVALGYVAVTRAPDPTDAAPPVDIVADRDTLVDSPLTAANMEAVARIVGELWAGKAVAELGDVPARFREAAQPIYFASRTAGKRHHRLWQNGSGTVIEELAKGLGRLRAKSGEEQAERVDTIHVELSHSFRDVPFEHLTTKDYRRSRRAVRAVEITHGDNTMRYGPSRMIETNRGPNRMRQVFRDQHKLTNEQTKSGEVKFRTFAAEEVIVTLSDPPTAKLVFRGNEIIDIGEVSAGAMENWSQLAIGWLRNNVRDDGRMTYIYWPSPLKEPGPGKNNMIRQWMATVALGKYAADRNDQAMWDLAERNIDFNLARYYHEEDDLGMIEWQGKVKLGAMGLATMALVEHPRREKWATQEAALRRSIDSLWHEDGSFTTFLKPKDRNDNTNFYPGEALLLWAVLYDQERDPALLEKFMKSFRYYKAWHLDKNNRNPAFTPWHTQAYYLVWSHTKDEALREFVFEMNDWLLGVQQWDNANYPDEKGQFYDGSRPFGPPHASSTGVYIEGLIDAFRMAREVDDKARTEAYRLALVRAMRSQLQLQFVDDVDMFYVDEAHRKWVRGGVRTTVYNNEIRCDNVQHPLMGILKVLREFGDSDYEHP